MTFKELFREVKAPIPNGAALYLIRYNLDFKPLWVWDDGIEKKWYDKVSNKWVSQQAPYPTYTLFIDLAPVSVHTQPHLKRWLPEVK